MSRLARLDTLGVLHHVMGRGIEKRKIFWNDKNRVAFINRLAGVVKHLHLWDIKQKPPLLANAPPIDALAVYDD